MGMHLRYQSRREAVPFITDFIDACEPVNFDLIIRIDSLSHSTDAWINNGDVLVKSGEASFRDIPASREDIWTPIVTALNIRGIYDYGLALQVMDRSRKGLYCSQGMPDNIEKFLTSLGLPAWFPGYLKQVKYLFPKGHCIAHLFVDLLYEWYAINYPDELAEAKKPSEQ